MENHNEAQLYNYTTQLLQSHEKLLRDRNRNRAFYQALKATIMKDSHVLDIGSGTGVWAAAAATLGAKRVVAIEQDPLLISVIKKTAADNGVADRVEVIQGDSRQVALDREFDVVVSETIGYLVFDESIVPIMIDARHRFLKEGGTLIPESVSLFAAGAHFRAKTEGLPAGIPIAENYFAALALNVPAGADDFADWHTITSPRELIRVNLNTAKALPTLEDMTARWQRVNLKRINCFAVWGEAKLAPRVTVSTRKTTSWSTMIYRVKPFSHDRGAIEFKLSLTSKSNYWHATFTNGVTHEVQSYSPAFAATELLAKIRTDAKVFRTRTADKDS